MQETINELIKMANLYYEADQRLETACGNNYDPIACTVFALKGKHTESLPLESHDAGYYLGKVVYLHSILVNTYKMNTDKVRAIWFPILNQSSNRTLQAQGLPIANF